MTSKNHVPSSKRAEFISLRGSEKSCHNFTGRIEDSFSVQILQTASTHAYFMYGSLIKEKLVADSYFSVSFSHRSADLRLIEPPATNDVKR